MLTREEFADYFNSLKGGLGDSVSPLWVPEEDCDPAVPSEWFICVKPLKVHKFKQRYWGWCNSTLKGKVRCYSSDPENDKEWWGFSNKQDIVLWTLKWT